MSSLSIGEFSRASRLSQKALRLYDELGLLPPARVDPLRGGEVAAYWSQTEAETDARRCLVTFLIDQLSGRTLPWLMNRLRWRSGTR